MKKYILKAEGFEFKSGYAMNEVDLKDIRILCSEIRFYTPLSNYASTLDYKYFMNKDFDKCRVQTLKDFLEYHDYVLIEV